MACPRCDLLMEKVEIPYGQRARCPRCADTLSQPVRHSVQQSLALSLTGLLLFIPANVQPLLSLHLNIFNLSKDATILQGVVSLYHAGLWIVAGMVLLSAIVVPLVNFLLMFYVSLSLALRRPFKHATTAFRLYLHLLDWSMLEVYLLGLLVCLVKLADRSNVIVGMGLSCFIGLLLAAILLATQVDRERFWAQLAQLNKTKE